MPNTTYQERKAAGVCVMCAGEVQEGYATCATCINLAKTKVYSRKEAGLCLSCGEPNDRQKLYCTSCANRQREQHLDRRKVVFDHYGWACACCGETQPEFLTIDHINNDGGKRRKEDKSHINLYTWLAKNNFPADFQTLCWNCNAAKRWGRVCPHQVVKDQLVC